MLQLKGIERKVRLGKLGFSETEIAKGNPRRSKRSKAGHLTEYEEQKRFVSWVKEKYPEHRRRLLAIGNASHRGSLMRASMDKAAGLLPGASDLFLRLPVGNFCGFWIEMKTVVGVATPEEKRFLEAALDDGYAGCVAKGCEEAKGAFLRYINGQWGER
jgi:hypothetical protein